ncbi:hypothetical protein Salat_2112000 [Sesamum alatum]|uniref:RNase H type-1 domain-containing protein n=1 Tax=Sesamum alatum TaxID=300844 RepID=A0AAE1Y0X9_9LAMI|nr:hypothetical protein Salat_2112000 [Sesamum alatum]
MENLNLCSTRIVESARTYLTDYTVAVTRPVILNRTEGTHVWQPPATGMVKINFDASLFTTRKDAGVGVVARDNEGKCLCWKSALVKNVVDPTHAEAAVAREAVYMALDFVGSQVKIEGDCLSVIKYINMEAWQFSSIGPLFDRRDANNVAHYFARSAVLFPLQTILSAIYNHP